MRKSWLQCNNDIDLQGMKYLIIRIRIKVSNCQQLFLFSDRIMLVICFFNSIHPVILVIINFVKSMLGQLHKNCSVNIKSNKLMSCLSLSTMTLLILSSVVIITIINVTPIVILGLGELQDGQRDLIITPKLDFINATKISLFSNQPTMPRINSVILLEDGQRASGWFFDFKMQKNLHLGTICGDEQDHHNFVYAHENLNLKQGDRTKLSLIDKIHLKAIKEALQNYQLYAQDRNEVIAQLNSLILDSIVLKGTFEVRQVFNTASGKFGIGNVNNFLYLDIKYSFNQILAQTYRSIGKSVDDSALIKFVRSAYFDLGHFATEATINLPNRIEVYSNPDYQVTYNYLSHFGEQVLEKIGLFSVNTKMPIASNLINLGYVGMFIGVMLKLIIVSLFILSVIMMNNMLLMGVERKNFDFALLKVMGADKFFIVVNLLTSSLKYVLFANFIAYPLAYLVLQTVTDVFQSFFGYKHQITPSFAALMGGLIIGVFVPIVSSIAPIWGVIKNDLAENLNPIRNKTQAIQTQVYVQGKQFPIGKLVFGILATSYGLMIYYLLPKSLINQNIGLLLVIFFIILQGLLVGLILISYSFQYIFEQIVAYITLFWINKTDFILTLKNLSSHRFKNRRSSVLYALSVSFIIFVSVGLQIQMQTIYNQLLKKRGCYVQVSGYIDRSFYNNILPQIDGIEDWAYITKSLNKYMSLKGVKQIMISDRAKLFFAKNQIYGVSPNLINTFFFDKVSVYKTDAVSPYDPYSYLYSPEGYMTCTVSKYIADRFGILEGNNHEFYINLYYENKLKRVPIKYSSVFDKRIGLLYSPILPFSQIGVSFDTYRTLANIQSDSQIVIEKIKLKIRDSSQASAIANRIRMANKGSDHVWQYTELKSTISRIQNILDNILTILLVVVLIISFFSLVTTTYVNIVNQTNQIGILMILGYEKSRIVKIYIYECFVLVVNSCLIGVAVGYFVAWMMGLQRQLFSDLPVEINVKGLPIIIVAAVISSILSTYKPLKEIFSNTISQIMNYAK